MGWFVKNHTKLPTALLQRVAKSWPIGVDINDDCIKLAQLRDHSGSVSLVAGGAPLRPKDITPASPDWQRWAVAVIRHTTATSPFRGNDVIAALPPSELFTDHIRMPAVKQSRSPDKLQDFVLSKIKQKLPFKPEDAMIKLIPTDQDHAIVIAAQRTIVDRHLAIYENAGLNIKSICVWPLALVTTYTRFFGRRNSDLDAVVMLLHMDSHRTNVVICRHKNLLFARSVPVGADQLKKQKMLTRLVMELTACKRQHTAMYRNAHTERLIFLAGHEGVKDLCTTIAKQLEMPAQMGDCLAAVNIPDPVNTGIERRDNRLNWAIAFGLSLS
jgi:Tfp pilus assembly PilM family ATPase